MSTVVDGIVIGAAGGSIAGLTVWIVQYIHDKVVNWLDKNRIYKWMKENTEDVKGKQFRSTRTIASWNNLTEDRVRLLCSIDSRIHLNTGDKEDMWSIYTDKYSPNINIG